MSTLDLPESNRQLFFGVPDPLAYLVAIILYNRLAGVISFYQDFESLPTAVNVQSLVFDRSCASFASTAH